jgi:hypothetical protein
MLSLYGTHFDRWLRSCCRIVFGVHASYISVHEKQKTQSFISLSYSYINKLIILHSMEIPPHTLREANRTTVVKKAGGEYKGVWSSQGVYTK